MWVEETSKDGLYFQRSANLSPGGIYLENTVPHPVGTVINLKFTLPDEGMPIQVRAEIVNAATGDCDFGMGLRFVDLPADTAERIARFVGKHGS
jgi:uncharacterized protein (TIGR02266 family)